MLEAAQRRIESELRLQEKRFEPFLVCPVCYSELSFRDEFYHCQNLSCNQSYPRLHGIPILLSETVSTFNLSAYTRHRRWRRSTWKMQLRRLIPRISANLAAKRNLNEFRRLLLAETPAPRVVVLGGARVGVGMQAVLDDERLACLESDVVVGPRTQIVFDASHTPLRSGSIDGVVVQAVLEYIPDPAETVAEIFRILKPHGIVYSEMPFLQNVHGGRYDFTRLTHLGHLRLFRCFDEIRSGSCAGPATALAWALQHLFLSFVKAPFLRDAIKIGSGLLLWPLKFFDHFLAATPGGLDSATGTYLLARKSNAVVSDRELIGKYRGAVPATEVL